MTHQDYPKLTKTNQGGVFFFFLRACMVALRISLGPCTREITQSSPSSLWKTLSLPFFLCYSD